MVLKSVAQRAAAAQRRLFILPSAASAAFRRGSRRQEDGAQRSPNSASRSDGWRNAVRAEQGAHYARRGGDSRMLAVQQRAGALEGREGKRKESR